MRILHLSPFLSGGGAEQQLALISHELARRGHDVMITYLHRGPRHADADGVALHQLNASHNHDPRLLFQLVRVIQHWRPDIIQTWMLQMDIAGGIAAKITSKPWVLREPSCGMGYSPTWKNRSRQRVGATANAVISNSVGGSNYWASTVPQDRLYVIRNAVDFTKISTALNTDNATDPTPVLLNVGRLASDRTGHKNLNSLLQALSFIRREREVRAIICGDGPLRSQVEAAIRNLELESCVRLAGFLPALDVWALMKRSAIFISLSAFEGCPNAVMEAAACECPLVLSDIPAHRELMNERSALFTNPNDPAGTARVVISALDDRRESKVRAVAAKERVESFNVESVTSQYESVYQAVASRH